MSRMKVSEQPIRKIFNCIVDDTALVAGVKRSTRNGIRQWVKNGQIRLFVPLHALDQLSRQRSANSRHGEDVRETLQWLDDATSKFPHIVTLQGAEETFAKWSDVEKFSVPRSLFSEADHFDLDDNEVDHLADDTGKKLMISANNHKGSVSSIASEASRSLSPSSLQSARSSVSPVSPPTSPNKAASSPAKPSISTLDAGVSSSSDGSVPMRLQPLFNYILWRIHQEVDPVAALESFIFLCNDPVKANYAKGFDVRYKRLEQLREAVGREDREFKNRQLVQDREKQISVQNGTDGADDAVANNAILPTISAAELGSRLNVIDPDAFGRTANTVPQTKPITPTQQSLRGNFNQRGNNRGNTRVSVRGRGNFGSINRGGFFASSRGRGEDIIPGPQIDPDSFERSRGGGSIGRGSRKLWIPS